MWRCAGTARRKPVIHYSPKANPFFQIGTAMVMSGFRPASKRISHRDEPANVAVCRNSTTETRNSLFTQSKSVFSDRNCDGDVRLQTGIQTYQPPGRTGECGGVPEQHDGNP